MTERPVSRVTDSADRPWQPAPGWRTLETFRQLGQGLLESGAPLVAYDAVAEGLRQFPLDVRLRQLLALSLARTGAMHSANQILLSLKHEGHTDEETLGMLARTHKDLWADSADPREQRRHLRLAFEYYRDAHCVSGGYWGGINAATMALLLGDRDQAKALATEVRSRCLHERQTTTSDDTRYWVLATLGAAALVLGDMREAEDWYVQAAGIGRGRWGDLVSTRRNARLIIRQLGVDGTGVEQALRVPRVVVFAGHLIDRPDRRLPRFPPRLETAVRWAIRDRLGTIDAAFGYASAACGSDILFLESILDAGGQAHVVLPYNRDPFLKDSVDIVPGSSWAERYARVLARATDVTIVSEQPMAGGRVSYEYALLLLDGAAALRADELDTELVSLAVWDGRTGDGPGGTATAVARWRSRGRPVEVIDLAEIFHREWPEGAALSANDETTIDEPATESGAAPSTFEPRIVGLLFGDAHGFSKLTEEEIPRFVRDFLGMVARELDRFASPSILRNTWGDGLYFVFDNVCDAGRFALDLCEVIGRTEWAAKGLPKDLSLRIGLHAGPAYACVDPVTNRRNYLGTHVSRAARIEPVTPPGQVYASGAFAALARAEHVRDFSCEYVGQMPLAKGYGAFPTYLVRRRRANLPL